MGSQNICQKSACFLRFAVQVIGQQDWFIAQLLRKRSCRLAKLSDTADDLGGYIAEFLGRFLMQQRYRLFRELQVVLFCDGQRIGTGRAVWCHRAGSDHIQRIAQNIGKHNSLHMGRGAPLGKTPTFDGGQPLADGIHLHNLRPTGQELVRDRLQLLTVHQRLFKQCAAAPGQQEQHRVLR